MNIQTSSPTKLLSIYEPRRKKAVLGVFNKVRLKPVSSGTETSCNIDILYETNKLDYYGFQIANNKGADQTAQAGLHL